jgi:hypothetical protein
MAALFMRVEFFLVLLYINMVAVVAVGVTLLIQIKMEIRAVLEALAGRLLV